MLVVEKHARTRTGFDAPSVQDLLPGSGAHTPHEPRQPARGSAHYAHARCSHSRAAAGRGRGDPMFVIHAKRQGEAKDSGGGGGGEAAAAPRGELRADL